MTVTKTSAWRHPWQVVQVWEDDGTTVAVTGHRTAAAAQIVAFTADTFAVLTRLAGAERRYHYDVRETPHPAPAHRFCIHCDANTTGPGPHAHTTDCPRHPANQGA